MRRLSFTLGFGIVPTEAIDAAESALGVTFPTDYRQFLTEVNGGRPQPSGFLVPDRDKAMVNMLFGVRGGRTRFDLVYEQELATELDPLPPGFIAIGNDPGGSSLLLSTTGDDAGYVYFWDRDGLWVREDGRNTFAVCSSFAVFLNGLQDFLAEA